MTNFISDALKMLRFKFYPLTHYAYPAWQPLAWLMVIGIVGGLGAQEFQAGLLERIIFFVILNLLEALLLSAWLMGWWRWIIKRPVSSSLFPVVVLASSAQLLEPLTRLLPATLAMNFAFPLAFYGVVLLVVSVATALNERRLLVVLAILAYFPVAMMLLHLAMSLVIGWGWIVPETLALPVSDTAF